MSYRKRSAIKKKRKKRSSFNSPILFVGIIAALLVAVVIIFIKNTKTKNVVETNGMVQDTQIDNSEEVVTDGSNNIIKPKKDGTLRVCLDAGHGGKDSGAVGSGNYEKSQALEIALLVKKNLEKKNIDVVMTRTDDTFVELEDRALISNRAGADVFVSIHRNSSTDSSTHGVETWIHSSKPEAAQKLADNIMNKLSTIPGMSSRGVKSGSMTNPLEDYRVNRKTDCTSCLIELGFMSSSVDTELVTTYKEQSAKAIADGILDYLGVN